MDEAMTLKVIMTVLCGVGLYASLFMLAKANRAKRGLLEEPSVVQTPRARLLGGAPNAGFGVAYYPLLAIALWMAAQQWELLVLLGIAILAGIVSAFLAYSLLFVTKMPCAFCWTSHGINWALIVLLLLLTSRT
jgi:uncharacterized membrane protein